MPFTHHARTLSAITESLTRTYPGDASVQDHGKYFSVFNPAGDLVFDVWAKDCSDGARDVARRRAHELRKVLDSESETLAAAE